jgi:hypothetical protein
VVLPPSPSPLAQASLPPKCHPRLGRYAAPKPRRLPSPRRPCPNKRPPSASVSPPTIQQMCARTTPLTIPLPPQGRRGPLQGPIALDVRPPLRPRPSSPIGGSSALPPSTVVASQMRATRTAVRTQLAGGTPSAASSITELASVASFEIDYGSMCLSIVGTSSWRGAVPSPASSGWTTRSPLCEMGVSCPDPNVKADRGFYRLWRYSTR